MIRDLDTSLLRSFVAIVESGSVTAAASALHLTQGAVSQQIRRLEETLQGALFVRDRRGMRLTPAGERLLGKAKRLLALNDEILAELTALTVEGEVRLGVPYDLVGTHVPPILKSFAEAHPRVEITLICSSSPELEAALTAGAVDLAIVEEEVGAARGECLAVERLVWVGGRGGGAHLKRPLPLSIVSEGCVFRPALFLALREHAIEWRTVFESGNLEATSATVRMDLAVTAWLASTVPPGLDVLVGDSGLPALPSFAIGLRLPAFGASLATRELARHLREGFLGRG